jgi:hypothetical protein
VWQTVIAVGDFVEYKCLSARGVSPWLECVVHGFDPDGNFDLGESIRSEVKRYVPRDSLRFVRHEMKRSRLRRLGSKVAAAASCSVM